MATREIKTSPAWCQPPKRVPVDHLEGATDDGPVEKPVQKEQFSITFAVLLAGITLIVLGALLIEPSTLRAAREYLSW